MPRRTSIFLAVCAVAVLVAAADAGAEDRWPLAPGWSWHYRSGVNWQNEQVDVLPDTRLVRGVATLQVLHATHTVTGDRNAIHFLTQTPEGDIFFHGYEALDNETLVSFDPPVLMIDQPMGVGSFWVTRSTAYAGLEAGGEQLQRFLERYEVIDENELLMPFGLRHAYGVKRDLEISGAAAGDAPDLLAALSPGGDKDQVHWYLADGIGPIYQYTLYLTEYHRPSTSVDGPLSWGGVKDLFR